MQWFNLFVDHMGPSMEWSCFVAPFWLLYNCIIAILQEGNCKQNKNCDNVMELIHKIKHTRIGKAWRLCSSGAWFRWNKCSLSVMMRFQTHVSNSHPFFLFLLFQIQNCILHSRRYVSTDIIIHTTGKMQMIQSNQNIFIILLLLLVHISNSYSPVKYIISFDRKRSKDGKGSCWKILSICGCWSKIWFRSKIRFSPRWSFKTIQYH